MNSLLAQAEIRLHPISFPFHASTLAIAKRQHSNLFPSNMGSHQYSFLIMDNKTKALSAFELLLPLLEYPGSFSQSIPLGSWIQGDVVSTELKLPS